ncbi:MAG: ABC transporter permease subunit [Rhodospirillaceae bacterium]|nr:ABC transporter permease subunit [Rhodospirillaceae bacterium]
MYSLIVAHETRSLAKTPSLLWILLLLTVAIGFGAWATSSVFERQAAGAAAIAKHEAGVRSQMRADLAKYEAEVKATGGKMEFAPINHAPGAGPPQGTNAGAVGSETASFAILPATGLAAMSIGQSDINLNYIPVSMKNIIDATKDNEIENPVNLKAGAFDIAFVIIFLMPIFILAMSYDLLSSEKERGTLAMVLAHPISLRKLMASKLISRMAIMLAVVLAFGLGAVLAVGSDLDKAETWARFGFWLGATVLYSLFWFGLAVLVNSAGKSSATNGIVLAGSWLAFVVIIPTLVSVVATTLYPAPSRLDFTAASREAQTAAEKESMKALDEYYYDHLELVPGGEARANDFLTLSLANNASIEKAIKPLYDSFQTQLNKQEEIVNRFQFLSPAIMMQLAMNEVAGTSADRYEYFMSQVFTFHAKWVDFFTGRFLKQEPLTTAEYDQFPSFSYVEEPFGNVVGRLLPSLLGLLVVVGGLTAFAFASLRKYRVAAR